MNGSFGPATTAAEVLEGVDLTGRRAIVTGGGSGIGLETARVLAAAGAEVTIAVRNTDVAGFRVEPLDLADQESVARFVRRWTGPLHILVNNAGVMATPSTRTREGWELQFATNHLGHFALAVGLHPALAAAGGARVVSVSSVGHINGDIDFDDPNFLRRPYDPWQAYSQSKTANVLFAVEAAKRWAPDRIAVNALNPGRIASTGLGRHLAAPPASFDPAGATGVTVKDIPQGAATSVLLAASPVVEGVTGRYFEDCQEAGPHQPGVRRGVAGYALDPERAARLWELSLTLIGQAGA
ncbi:SDR family NAD(P)-dependent oxidoreductase [Actinoplanes bogorensis]|uniref:SDR family NAD(P)-dependent oxidoreductase n=1 Tax=Paractinoplanes bogorensis TaxID=1610840 RepID=A0ABS5YRM2_9ACTN|nr:SDR family NAD(P)-dependent oxidoreductase [Actinoplanes bogorensis]MBU2666089.1 SDR family NAD(P)-dependent oxidoreductase [Actinoplanes bogorensis]